MLGIPEKIIDDGGPSYNGRKGKNFGKEMKIKIVKCTPENSQSNGIVERFSTVLVKIIHAAMAEGRIIGQKYRVTCYTIISPCTLVQGSLQQS